MSLEPTPQQRAQPAKPAHYRMPPVVQPQWHFSDLLPTGKDDEANLRQALCEAYSAKHCLLLDRARSGLYLLAKAFGLDGRWILTSLMHRPSALVLKNHTAGMAFADVDDQMCLDPVSAERMVTPDTCALLATHTYGKAADLPALRAVADRHGLALIENAVHMSSGTRLAGRPIGTWSDATLLSFNVDKPLGGILGGALLTNRDDVWNAVSSHPLAPANTPEMRERIRTSYLAYRLKPLILRLPWASAHRGEADGINEVESFGSDSYRKYSPRTIHPLQARVARSCIAREARVVEARKERARRLNGLLSRDRRFTLPQDTAERPHCYTYYPLFLERDDDRYSLGMHLAQRGIESKWRLAPLHLQEGLRDVPCDALPASDSLWARHLLLPAGPNTSMRSIDELAEAILEWRS